MNGPKLWADMLAAINVPGAVVAGGCIRDWYLGVAPKDVDVCIPALNQGDMANKVQDLRDRGLFRGHDYSLGKSEGSRIDCTFGVSTGELLGHKVDLIARIAHLDGPQALIESFDFGILQVYYDGESCKATPAQRADLCLQRATMAHDRHVEQSLQRFFRFNARNPGLLSLNVPYAYTPGQEYVAPII